LSGPPGRKTYKSISKQIPNHLNIAAQS